MRSSGMRIGGGRERGSNQRRQVAWPGGQAISLWASSGRSSPKSIWRRRFSIKRQHFLGVEAAVLLDRCVDCPVQPVSWPTGWARQNSDPCGEAGKASFLMWASRTHHKRWPVHDRLRPPSSFLVITCKAIAHGRKFRPSANRNGRRFPELAACEFVLDMPAPKSHAHRRI